MVIRLLLIFIFVGLISCKSGLKEDTTKITLLKKNLLEQPTQENRNALINEYKAIIVANPTDAVTNAQHLNQVAQFQVTNKSFSVAIQTLMDGIKEYFSAPGTADNVWSLGKIYEDNLNSPKVAGIIKKMYAQQFPNGSKAGLAQQFVSANTINIADDIAQLGSSMYNETTHRVDFKAANDFIKVCELYALLKPQDEQSPEYLHKAGETARAIRSFPKAIVLYDWIYTKYPSYEKAPQSLFLKAFTYDNDLGDKEKAKLLYQEFLKKFPNDDFADDTEFLLANIDKNDEEIIKSFGQQ